MIRATTVTPAGKWKGKTTDTVVLDYDQRHRRRMAMTGNGGTEFLLDLSDAMPLRDGDGLTLEDGRIVRVEAAPEPLAEIHAHDDAELLRVAWHLGNRHLPAQLTARVIRIRRDHVIEEMVEGLGAHVHHIDAPFDPEGGAYSHGHHHHPHVHHEDEGALEHDDRIEENGIEDEGVERG
ncbi:MAG TPA: urease accessory protein UreE [Bauldia sp.]|nr:urease accessory protein UreE [Bauldia sp.]